VAKHDTLLGNWTCVSMSISKTSQPLDNKGEADVIYFFKPVSNETIGYLE